MYVLIHSYMFMDYMNTLLGYLMVYYNGQLNLYYIFLSLKMWVRRNLDTNDYLDEYAYRW